MDQNQFYKCCEYKLIRLLCQELIRSLTFYETINSSLLKFSLHILLYLIMQKLSHRLPRYRLQETGLVFLEIKYFIAVNKNSAGQACGVCAKERRIEDTCCQVGAHGGRMAFIFFMKG